MVTQDLLLIRKAEEKQQKQQIAKASQNQF